MIGAVLGNLVTVIKNLATANTNITTIDTVVDRIEVDTTSIESKVDIVDTVVDKIIHPKKVTQYSLLKSSGSISGYYTITSLSGRGLVSDLSIGTSSNDSYFRITCDGIVSDNIYCNLGETSLTSDTYFSLIKLEFTTSCLIELYHVTGTAHTAKVSVLTES
jgi:hypothetical protein